MQMRRYCYILLSLLGLSGCVTTQKSLNFRYEASDERALVAFNHRSLDDDGSITLRQIDAKTGVFIGPMLEVTACFGCLNFNSAFFLEPGKVPEFIFSFFKAGYLSGR